MKPDARAIGRARTEAEKRRRHIHGDRGARYSQGKYMVLLAHVMPTITTFTSKDCLLAEITETA